MKLVEGSRGTIGLDVIIGGETNTILMNGPDASMTWPTGAGGSVTLYPKVTARRRGQGIEFNNGAWAIVDFLRSGHPKVQGTQAFVSQEINGRVYGMRFSFDSTAVPFLMQELRTFACPAGLE